jgi:hypothetical protein
MLMNERIAEIKTRCEAATLGPWNYFPKPKYKEFHVSLPIEGYGMRYALFPDGCPTGQHDAEFIAHSRQDIPDLLDEIERLTRERDAAVTELKIASGSCKYCAHHVPSKMPMGVGDCRSIPKPTYGLGCENWQWRGMEEPE